jgi:hypothetical protein
VFSMKAIFHNIHPVESLSIDRPGICADPTPGVAFFTDGIRAE